jgi:hypothetical protein
MIYNVTIAASGTVSGTVGIAAGEVPVAIQMPSAWTTADMTFKTGVDTADVSVYTDAGVELTVASPAASRLIMLYWPDYMVFAETRHLSIRSGTAASPVTQAAERVLKLITLPVNTMTGVL